MTRTKSGAKAPKVDKKHAAAFERLGITIHAEPRVDPASIGLDGIYLDKLGWLAHAEFPSIAFRSASEPTVRGLRFVAPWRYPHRDAAPRVPSPRTVFAQSPDHVFYVSSYKHFETAIPPGIRRSAVRISEILALLQDLVPDEAFATREVPVADRIALSPLTELHVFWSLAQAGITDLAPRAIPLREAQQLETLGLTLTDSLEDLDARFGSLTTLHIRQAKLADVRPLLRLPRLRRLMLLGCLVEDPAPLAEATALEELHLPGCLLSYEQLEFVAHLPTLRSVTIAGNLVHDAPGDWLERLPLELRPTGTSDVELRFAREYAAQNLRVGVALDERFLTRTVEQQTCFSVAAIERGGRVGWHFVNRSPTLAANALSNTLGPMANAEPEFLTVFTRWPGQGVSPAVAQFPAEGLDAVLATLGATRDPERDSSAFATATQKRLAEAAWPARRYAYRAEHAPSRRAWNQAWALAGALQDPQRLDGCEFVPLHEFAAATGRRPLFLFGRADGGRRLLVLGRDPVANPSVYVYDAAAPIDPLAVVDLMDLLRGLSVDEKPSTANRAIPVLHDGTPWPLAILDQIVRLRGKPPERAVEHHVETIVGSMPLSPIVSALMDVDWGDRAFVPKDGEAGGTITFTPNEITEPLVSDERAPLYAIAFDDRRFWDCVRVDDTSSDPAVYRVDCDGGDDLERGVPLSLFLLRLKAARETR